MQTTWLASRTLRLCCLKSATAILRAARRWNNEFRVTLQSRNQIAIAKRHFRSRLISVTEKLIYNMLNIDFGEDQKFTIQYHLNIMNPVVMCSLQGT